MATKSQVVTVVEGSNGAITATTEDATLIDTITTLFSTKSSLTGAYGLLQRGGLFVGGMAVQSKLKTNSFNFLK